MNDKKCPLVDTCEYFRIDTQTGQCDGTHYPNCIYGNIKPEKKKRQKKIILRCSSCNKVIKDGETRFRYYNVGGVWCESCAEKETPGITKE